MVNYNIAQLFDIAFGIKEYKIGVPEKIDNNQMMSYLGTPIMSPIWFESKKYQVFDDFGDIKLEKFERFRLPSATLVSMRRAKIMTETKARASKGSVIEMYGFEAWKIDIRGFCLPDPAHKTAQSAYEQKLKLQSYENIVDSIGVLSELFNDLDISNIVIKEINFNQLKGKPEVIPFYIRCLSDEPLELIV